MTILVTGATGNIGRLVVEGLLEAGASVRAVTRFPETAGLPAKAEVVHGDLTRPDTLAEALRGVEAVYLFPVAATAGEVVGLIEAAGAERVVTLSSGAVEGGYDTDFHLPVEQAVEASGMAWTHVRPGEFMLNKLWLWGPSIRAERTVREPSPDALWCPVHERDIAEVAVAALTEDGHAGAAYPLNGPQALSLRDQAREIAAALGEDVRFERVTPQEARELYRRQGGFAAANADFLLGFTDYGGAETTPGEADGLDASMLADLPTAAAVTGRPARTFAAWAREHAGDFR
ncbi:NAD(P)H-binding protein [Actinomadura macrotermitis]|uniref:NAD(P)H azoreductase n=1 Tax=Actinomadura macrotermitis TaxID=2585200 RepID=A0A7K0BUT1_9ACTN|nr:NAD(P)H-binding protein [Actinomadura macrotermitis]MQY04965.1 NAD(P)H azoreductase [Actinomadura macrotermitis]